jgi:hypothetical protein
MTTSDDASGRESLGATRLLIGLAQGVALLLLKNAGEAHAWPWTDPWLHWTLVLCFTFVPLTVFVGLGQLRRATLGVWILGCVALTAATVGHGIARDTAVPATEFPGVPFGLMPVILFIAYHLVAAADVDRRIIAPYRSYFDIAWKNGVQLGMSLAFLGAFWLLLYLGAALFELIQITFVREIIQEDWFYFPVTATVFALAAHVTDVRVGLINGIRAVALVLLSWLLPVMTLLAVAFLAALPATGLAPLWATGSATAIVLTAAATLVILINAAYQDGLQETPPHRALRIAARVAGVAIVPLVAIAAYSVWLRVAQHGLTPERVVALAILGVAACYAAGYAVAALWPGRWFKPLEITNVLTSVVALGLIVAMLTSVADPARIAVDDQVRRLRAGLITPEAFDYAFLRFNAARYGRDALEALVRDKSTPRAQVIAAKAQAALTDTVPAVPTFSTKELLAKVVVRPQGARLPENFINQDWSKSPSLSTACPNLPMLASPCSAHLLDFDGDGVAEVLIGAIGRFHVYRMSADGIWRSIGYFETGQCGVHLPNFLEFGKFQLVSPQLKELEVAGQRLRLQGCAE